MIKHASIACACIALLALATFAPAATPTPQPTPPGGFPQFMTVQPCTIASDGHFYAAAYDLTTGGVLGPIDAWNSAVLQYTMPPRDNWAGIYLYDYTATAWCAAEYVYRELMSSSATPTPIPADITLTLPGGVPLEFMRIPAGAFQMGQYPGEQDGYYWEIPQHTVSIAHDFYMAKYELTKRQWLAVMGTTPWSGQTDMLNDLDSPAVYMSWDDTQAFIATLNTNPSGSLRIEWQVRLPSEAEWEYAARAGTTTRFYWGDDPTYSQIEAYAWYRGNTYDVNEPYAHLVGQKLPNAWGLYDMSGNVWEWCQDEHHESYDGAPPDGSAWQEPTVANRILRSSSWNYSPQYCRSANRDYFSNNFPLVILGFRLVAVPVTGQ